MSEARPLFAVIGDVHAELARLERVLDRIDQLDPRAVLMVGDLACAGNGRVRSLERILRYRRQRDEVLAAVRRRGRPFAFVPGNHDLSEPAAAENIDGRTVELAGLRVAGIGGAGPERFGFAYEWDEGDIRALRLPPHQVLLCHAPPRDCALDRTHHGWHVGSQALAERARSLPAGLLLCGHIHEAMGVDRIGDCLVFNVGALGSPFGQACLGLVDDLDRLRWESLDEGRAYAWRRGPGGVERVEG